MINNHAIYKKIAIATIVIAPFLVQIASRQMPPAEQTAEPEPSNSVAAAPSAPPPPPPPAPPPAPITPLQPADLAAGPFDPRPSVDPSAVATAMAPQPISDRFAGRESADGPADPQQTSSPDGGMAH